LGVKTGLKKEAAWDLTIEMQVWVCRGDEISVLAIRPKKQRKEQSLNTGDGLGSVIAKAEEIELLERALVSLGDFKEGLGGVLKLVYRLPLGIPPSADLLGVHTRGLGGRSLSGGEYWVITCRLSPVYLSSAASRPSLFLPSFSFLDPYTIIITSL
jgi:hypothetical protein